MSETTCTVTTVGSHGLTSGDSIEITFFRQRKTWDVWLDRLLSLRWHVPQLEPTVFGPAKVTVMEATTVSIGIDTAAPVIAEDYTSGAVLANPSQSNTN